MRRTSLILAATIALALAACSSDDDLPSPEAGPSTFDRILDGERGFIPDPNGPAVIDDCFGGVWGDPIEQAFECPLIVVDPGDIPLVLDDLGPAEPDLVIATHETAMVDEDNVIHVVTIRNVGTALAVIDDEPDNDLLLQFVASTTPSLDGDPGNPPRGAGGILLTDRTLEPGEEFEYVFPAGSGNPDQFDYSDFNYIIGTITGSPDNDANPDNNVSVTPLVPAP